MNNEKEIEEMGVAIFKSYGSLLCQPCGSFDSCEKNGKPDCGLCDGLAKDLINANYGNVKQAVEEFAEKVKPIIGELVELMFNDYESHCKVTNCEKDDDIPCGCSICIEENEQLWKSKIDNLITELYGADE